MRLAIFSKVYTCILLSILGNCQNSKLNNPTSDNFVYYDPLVKISTDTSSKIFPAEWSRAPMSAHAEPLSAQEASRSIAVVRNALDKYPKSVINNNINNIYLCFNLLINNTKVGGIQCKSNKSIYINNNGAEDGYSNSEIEKLIHHELAHLLMEYYGRKFSRKKWERLNSRRFRYGKGGLEYQIKHHGRSDTSDEECLKKGFVNEYAMSDFDEDFASTVEAMFQGTQKFWSAVDQNKILQDKVKMVMSFYQSIDKSMTEAYFEQIRQAQALVPPEEDGPVHYGPNQQIPFPWGGSTWYPNPVTGVPVYIKIERGGTGSYPPGGGYTMNPKPDGPRAR